MYTQSYKAYLASLEALAIQMSLRMTLIGYLIILADQKHTLSTYGSVVKAQVYKLFIQLQAPYVASNYSSLMYSQTHRKVVRVWLSETKGIDPSLKTCTQTVCLQLNIEGQKKIPGCETETTYLAP